MAYASNRLAIVLLSTLAGACGGKAEDDPNFVSPYDDSPPADGGRQPQGDDPSPSVPQTPDEEIVSKLRDCGLLTEGLFPGGGSGECEADCTNNASCEQLEAVVCGGDFDSPLAACLISCPFEDDDFVCANGESIPGVWQCDSEEDCFDGSDEFGCENTEFVCGNGEVIPRTWECDQEEDCFDGSDEAGCAQISCD